MPYKCGHIVKFRCIAKYNVGKDPQWYAVEVSDIRQNESFGLAFGRATMLSKVIMLVKK